MSDADLRIPAHFYAPAARSTVQVIVLHTTEGTTGARALATAWSKPSSPHVSAHWILDDADDVQAVAEKDRAWAAGETANHVGIHIEIVGFTLPPRDKAGHVIHAATNWDDHPTLIDRVGRRVADIAARWSLPLEFVDAAGLVRGDRGITIHREVSAAWRETNHVDGTTLPMSRILATAMAVRSARAFEG